MFKKLAVLLAALAVSAPAFADRGNRDHYRGGHGHGKRVVVHKPYHVVHRPVVVHPRFVHHYYRPAPRPVVHHYYRPAPRPVYVVQQPHYNGAALLVGAVIGAAIVHHAVTGY